MPFCGYQRILLVVFIALSLYMQVIADRDYNPGEQVCCHFNRMAAFKVINSLHYLLNAYCFKEFALLLAR